MAIDICSEVLISLRDACRLLPARRRGKKPHVSCLYRWTTTGYRGIVLEAVNVGGTRCTTREALGRFIRRISAPAVDGRSNPKASEKEQQLDRIDRALDHEKIN
jgi:Protein of unknown function (DUF1580)